MLFLSSSMYKNVFFCIQTSDKIDLKDAVTNVIVKVSTAMSVS